MCGILSTMHYYMIKLHNFEELLEPWHFPQSRHFSEKQNFYKNPVTFLPLRKTARHIPYWIPVPYYGLAGLGSECAATHLFILCFGMVGK